MDASPQALGAIGLALGSAFGSWVEYISLKRLVSRSLPTSHQLPKPLRKLTLPLITCGIIGGTMSWAFNGIHALILGPVLLIITGLIYVGLTYKNGSRPAKDFLRFMKLVDRH